MQYVSGHKCPSCGVYHTVNIPGDEAVIRARIHSWSKGMKIQEALPTLDAEKREIIMTGMCDKAWDELFGDEE